MADTMRATFGQIEREMKTNPTGLDCYTCVYLWCSLNCCCVFVRICFRCVLSVLCFVCRREFHA